ncbi:MAG: phosphatidylglycerophosphatase A [Thermodesulfobacteriota bacterium]
MNFKSASGAIEKMATFLATGFGIGKIPFAPGTFGSAAGLPICYLISRMELMHAFLATLFILLFSIWIAHLAEKRFKINDPGEIVIDEIAGIVVTFFGLPFDPYYWVLGFILFRIADILKPYPIRIIDRGIHGGWGIVLDDLLAGIYANLFLRGFGMLLTK